MFVSVIVGVTSIGNPSRLGVVGGSTVLYYVVTMLFSVSLGATMVSTFQPGDLGAEQQAALETLLELGFAKQGRDGEVRLCRPSRPSERDSLEKAS